jgi:phage gpG-like protein
MIGVAVKIENRTQAVAQSLQKESVRLVGHAAASLRKRAIESIQPAEGPSEPGQPPHTRPGKVSRKTGKARPGQLQRAIVYAHDKRANVAVIGPRESVVGDVGQAHEFGGEFRGEDYPERPFMTPALEVTEEAFGSSFAGSLSG